MPPTLLVPGSIEGIDEVPIKYITSWIKNHMYEYGYNYAYANDRILIIQAKTGSGKSTVMPVELFRILRNKDTSSSIKYRGQKVLCTQPRVLTAIELARTISSLKSPWNPDMTLGKIVGYSTGPKKEKATGLIYATAGVLRAKLNSNTDTDLMNEFKFIIIDEAHERSVDSDVLLFMLYKFYKRNAGNKMLPFLILTSATFDTNKYAKYFEVSTDNIIKVSGSTYSITDHFLPHDASNIYESIVKTVIEINKNDDQPDKADILIFAPGVKEMKEIENKINYAVKEYILILKLDGEAVRKETSDYLLVFEQYKKLPKKNGLLPKRRIILSTSVAETGLTIDTLKYVIDMGYHKGLESYPIINVKGLVTRPAPQSRIIQRKGRCGRLFDGSFYPMYTKETFELLDHQQLPDILTSSEEYNFVHLSFYRILGPKFDINELKLLDRPSQETFIGANSIATILGFINHNCELTNLGLIASKFSSIPMPSAKIILSGFVYNVAIIDLITITALMQINNGSLFMREHMYRKFMESVKGTINKNIPCDAYIMESILPKYIVDIVGGGVKENDPDSDNYYFRYKTILCDDFIESLLAFEAFNKQIITLCNNKLIMEWCQKKCINYSMLSVVYDIRERIIEDLLNAGIDILYGSEHRLIDQSIDKFIYTVINIKKCLYEGLKHNLLTYDANSKSYKSVHDLSISVDNSIMSQQLQNKLKAIGTLKDNINPKYIITDQFNLNAKNEDFIMYSVSANYVSILDGYVHPDPTFGEPMYDFDEKITKTDIATINDDWVILDTYHKILETDIKLPVCSLDCTVGSLFGPKLIEHIIKPMCE